jgi:uncharacterized protein (DUF1499 family)
VALQRPSTAASLAAFDAGAGGVLALLGPTLAHVGLVRPMVGFETFLLGTAIALLGLVLGGIGLRATRGGRRAGRDRAWFAVGVGGVALVALLLAASPGRGLPAINDITTNPEDPPAFEVAARQPANRGRNMAYPPSFAAQQREAYPDLRPIDVDLPPVEAFERARRSAQALGWEITLSDPERGLLEARDTSLIFRFVDDVAIRVRPHDGGSVIDVRSKSRDGKGDLGANATRIRRFAAEVASEGSPGL